MIPFFVLALYLSIWLIYMIGAKAKELIGESMRRNEGDRERNKGAYKSQRESHQRRRPSKRIKKNRKTGKGLEGMQIYE